MMQLTDEGVQEWVGSYLAQILLEIAAPGANSINDFSPFAEMGVDSFRILKIIKRLESDFGSLPKTLLFENVNIDELARYFVTQHRVIVDELMGVRTTAATQVAPSPVPATVTPAASTPPATNTSPSSYHEPAKVIAAPALPHGPLLLLEDEARSHSVLGGMVAEIFDRHKNEAGASRGARTIAPNLFIGSSRRGFFNYARCKNIIIAYAYSGPDENFDEIAGEFQAHCTARDLQLNIFADRVLGSIGGTQFTATPFGLLQRITALPDFTLEGGAMRRLRYLVQKFAKLGAARTEEYRLGGSAEVESGIADVIDRWCAGKPMVNPLIGIVRQEILSRTLDPRHRLFLTYLDDVLQNVILISPLGPDYNGYLMDLEFYDATMPLGGLEFAITKIVEQLVADGHQMLSMGGTYGCRIETCADADPEIDRVLDDLQAQGIFDDHGNMQFKNKFRPDNRSIYLCRPSDSGSPENVIDVIMMIADPLAMQTSDEENFSLRPVSVDAAPAEVANPVGVEGAPASQALSPVVRDATTREEQLGLAGNNPANVPNQHVAFDLRTDSWAQLRMPAIDARMEHLRAQLQVAVPTDQALRTLFPFTHFLLTSSGHTAEEVLYASLERKGGIVENLLFPTGLFHQIDNGFDPLELVRAETLDPSSGEIFKGDLDLALVRRRLSEDGASIALACVEASNNAAGGLPVSMANLFALRSLLAAHRIPLVLDATRILDNAHLIVAHEIGFAGRQVWDVAREMLGLADIVTCSLAKNFCINRGGLIATNDRELFQRLGETMAKRAGRLDAIDRKLVALAVQDRRRIETLVARRLESVRLLWDALRESGIPLAGPVGGHALLIDVRRISVFRDLDHPVASFLAWLYLNTGIRAGAHSVGMQKGTAINDMVRLAIPVGLRASEVEQLAQRLVTQFALLQNIPHLALAAGARASDPLAHFVVRAMGNPSPIIPVTRAPTAVAAAIAPSRATTAPMQKPSPEAETTVAISSYRQRDIAIIGMAGRYPKARTLDQLWRNLAEGNDCVGDIPAERVAQRRAGSYPKSYRGGFIDDIDRFDSLFFNVSPRDAELLDPQERLFLEVAWEAMEDAGYTLEGLVAPGAPRNVGVYVGAVWTMYQMYGVEEQHAGRDASPNSFLWSIANHVSYSLNLNGPSMTVDTACSSSLTALYLACEAIYKGECASAIVGGVNLDLHPGKLAINRVGGALSQDGVCRAFGKGANGYVAGEGIGAVLIKPLEDAIRDGDAIHGVIKGIAVNHGGRSNGYAVPNPRAQADVIQTALDRAGVDPASIGYIEAHGTGTELGDPIEIRALSSAFEKSGIAAQSCAIGSIKSNIGHLEAAAGIVGVCKVLLQMRYGQLAPSLHARETNDFIDFEESPFYVVQELEPWRARQAGTEELPLRAGVSSFGAGGSNAHVILESFKPVAGMQAAAGNHVFPLSARSEEQLGEQARRLGDHLTRSRFVAGDDVGHDLAAIARTLQLGRNAHEYRAAIVAADVSGLIAGLNQVIAGKGDESVAIGNARNSASLAKLLNVQEQDQFTRLLSGSGDHRRLARLWADGMFSRWNGAGAEAAGSRVHLPTYPFADRRHWISDGPLAAPWTGLQSSLHMLVDANESTFERQIFRKRFSDGDFFIHDHLVSDIPTLPGVAYLEFARKAGELAAGRPVRRIRNVLWLSPIAVRDGAAQDVLIELKPNGAAVQFEVFSIGENDAAKVHAQGQLLFTASDESADEHLDLEAIRARAVKTLDGRVVYPQLDDAGLKLGSSFQVLHDIYANGDETLGRLVLPPERRADLAELALHPSLIDGALQTGVASQLDSDTAEMAVPYSIGEVEILHPLPAECWSHVTVISDGKSGKSRVRRANVTITDAEGRVLVRLRDTIGVPLTAVHNGGASASAAEEALCYVPVWREQALSDAAPALDGTTLWFDRDRDRAGRAAERLRARGGTGKLVVVEPAAEFVFDDRFHLDPADPEHFVRLMERLDQDGHEVRRICWALPLAENGEISSEHRLHHGVFALMSLAKALTVRKLAVRVPIVYAFASAGGQPAGEHEAVAGFGKALRLEDPKLLVKTLELRGEAASGDAAIDAVLAEYDTEADAIRIDGGKRQIRVMQAAVTPAKESATPLREGGVYLITGGAGGLGLIFAEHLARTSRAKLVLTGRSQPSAEISARLAPLEALGAEVLYLAADVAHADALTDALAEARGRFGPLHGVIHSAGVLRDSYLRNKSLADMQAVLAPKVAGTIVLDEATREDPLDFFVTFSSMSAVGGNPGQCDYCFANAFMDSFASTRDGLRAKGERAGRTLSLNWSLWAEGGMRLDAQSEQLFRNATGIKPLSTAMGVAAFTQALARAEPQILVVRGDQDRIETSLGLRKPLALAKTEPVAARREANAGSDNAGVEQAVARMLHDELSQIVLDHLKLAPEDLETDKILLDLGFDSIGLATFANAVNARFELEITPILFFDYPSIDEIVRHLAAEQGDKLSRFVEGKAPAAAEPAATSAEPVMFRSKGWTPDAAKVAQTPAAVQTAATFVRDEPIAVVGISGTMPQSADLHEFWENLREGRDLIGLIPPDRWSWEEHFGDPLREPDKTNSKWGGFMSEVDKFDPLFFGISPVEARMMDPQQRLFLQNVWEAVEDSGHKLADLAGTRTGLFVGVATNDYVNIINRQKIGISAYTASGNSHAMLANRVSYLLNLRGPSAPIDTACSSSLIALHRAVESIKSGNCDMAIIGGVQVMLTPAAHVSFSMAGMLSPEGRCKAFDKNANGYVRGEGSGAVLIKRLADAEADGDHIYAVVRATAENHGGRVTTLTAPNAAAQSELLVHAYTKAGVDPATVGFIECHGTGTALGDPIEFQALNRAFGQLYERSGKSLPAAPHCGLSSVKTNIGHLETAAGIASILTTVLAIKHRQIPANLHLEEVNPYISLKGTPFYIPSETTDWEAPHDADGREQPRRAGISSFGFGGANAHIVLEEYVPAVQAAPAPDGPRLFVLSARNRDRLRAYSEKLLVHLDRETVDLAELSYTLQVGRDAFAERLAFVADSLDGLRESLASFLADSIGPAMRTGSGIKQANAAVDAAQIRSWIEAGDLLRLADAWIAGAEIDWTLLYPKGLPRRAALPTYPFARERYWIPDKDGAGESVGEQGAGAAPLHPLVHRNVSTLQEQRYASHFDGRESFLRDHVVEGERILPGVAYVEMARFAGTLGAGNAVRSVRKLVWMAPLIVGKAGADVEIALVPKREDVAFRITSLAEGGIVTHCTGLLGFADGGRSADQIDMASTRRRMTAQVLDRAALYQYFESAGLALGATFRVVERIWASETEALAELRMPEEAASEIDRFGLHPGVMDGSLHSAIGLMKSSHVDPPLSLPFSVGEVEIFGSLKDVRYSHASWADRAGQDDPNHWKVNFLLLDADGRVLVSVRNFATKPLHRGQSVALRSGTAAKTPAVGMPNGAALKAEVAAPDSELWSLVPGWSPIPQGDAVELPVDSRILLVGNDPAALQWLRARYPAAGALSFYPDKNVAELAARLKEAEFDQLVWIAPDVAAPLRSQEPVAAQTEGVLAVLTLTKALLAAGQGGRNLHWTLVTARTQSVRQGDEIDPSHASIFGYFACLAKEYPHWSLRLVDLESLDAVTADTCLTLPWCRAGGGYVYRRGEWLCQDLVVLTRPAAVQPSVRQGGVYVVIGGAGGIGQLWSRHLAEVYGARTVWIGRREADAAIEQSLDEIARVGPRPLYLSADATDPAALAAARDRILATYPTIHGVVHSALVLSDHSIAQMDRAEFVASLAAKVDVSVNLDQVFGDLDLDFLLFFSSIITLRGSAGQSNYAAGCAFEDAFAQALGGKRPYPVKVINWGYWGDVGVVADTSYRKAMEQMAIGSIEPSEGWAQIELLLGSALGQIAVVKTMGAQAAFGFAGLDRITLRSAGVPPVLDPVASDWVQATEQNLERLRGELPLTEQDRLVAEILAAILRERGWLAGSPPKTLASRFLRWLDGSRQYLREAGWIDAAGEALRPIRALETLWQEWSERRTGWTAARPHHASQTSLLETCLKHLPEVLSGERAATEILFPNSSFELVEGVYRGSPLADHFNDALSQTLAACVARWLDEDPARKIRILEIGAGTGGTTAGLLPVLARFGDTIAEYCFTDLSRAFLLHAAKTFQSQCPAMTTAVFDVGKPLAGQGIEAGRYDLVIAANVLHATPDIRATVRNAKAALVDRGVLLLNEISAWSAFSHLTFGLLDGWWAFEDGALRMPHGPGLAPRQWQDLLGAEGFAPVFFPAASAHAFGQQIVAAASDGIVRQSAVAPTRRAAHRAPAAEPPQRTEDRTVVQVREEAANAMGYEQVRRLVAEKLSEALQLDMSRINDEEPFAEYGVDSIVGVNLVRMISEALEIDLDPTALFEYVTIRQLSEHIFSTWRAQLTGREGTERTAAQATESRGWRQTEAASHRVSASAAITPAVRIPAAADEPIAIVGVSGRFAESETLEDFWRNLESGRDLVTQVSRWSPEESALATARDVPYCDQGSFVGSADLFDPAFFRISPGEALYMDPQQRLFLEEAWKALEDAGYANKERREKRCGVFVGCGGSKYDTLLGEDPPAQTFWGNSEAVLPARIAYYLDLQGPAVPVNTACSSSLVTIHLACQSLRLGETDMCLAGGVFLQPTPGFYQVANRAGMLSPQGRCFAFDSRADGFVPGEGVGVLVLKRLSDAQRSGDHIHGVIIGSAVNQDGASNGIIAPNAAAQERLASELYDRFSIDPASIQMLEAHGTGTILGDAIEFGAITKAFRKYTDEAQFCAIGSVKSNIGHAATAAGVASVIKTLLAMRHRRIPASINFVDPNPAVDIAASPFYLPTVTQEWPDSDGGRRRAAVSSFGFSGTNAHLVIEEAPAREQRRADHPGYLIALSARTEDQLGKLAHDLAACVEASPDLPVADVSYTLLIGRTRLPSRLALVARDRAELLQKLRGWLDRGSAPGIATGLADEDASRPRASLSKFGAFCIEQYRHADAEEALEHLGTLADLFVQGCSLDYEQVFAPGEVGRVPLPSYPLARERYWVDAPVAAARARPLPVPGRPAEPAFARAFPGPTAGSWSPAGTTPQGRLEWWLRHGVAAELRRTPDTVATDLPFFDLGLTSLSVADLIRKINAELDIAILPSTVFDHPNIRSLASWLSATYPDMIAALDGEEGASAVLEDNEDILRQIVLADGEHELAGYEKLTF